MYAEGKELVVDVGLVGEEGVTVHLDAVEVDPHDVEAGYQEGRESNHGRIDVVLKMVYHAETDAEHAQDKPDGQRPCVAHEDLAVFLGVAEHVVVEEGDQSSEGGEGEHGIEVEVCHVEDHTIEGTRYRTKPRGKSVDAVDEVDGVGDEDGEEGGQQDRDYQMEMVDPEETVEVVNHDAACNHQGGGEDLHDELRAVFQAYQVICHSHEVEGDDGAGDEAEGAEVGGYPIHHESVLLKGGDTEDEEQGEDDRRKEGYAAETWHRSLVDLARVDLIEEVLAERYEKDLRDDDARNDHHTGENGNVNYYPVVHRK